MKRIKLTQGKYAIVDDEDYGNLSKKKWRAAKAGKTYYAHSTEYLGKINGKFMENTICMHREILGLRKGDGAIADHKNRNGLDNRKLNLRIVNAQQSVWNRTSSKLLKGVTSYKPRTKTEKMRWAARIMVNGKSLFLGCFKNAQESALAYNEAATKYYGEYAQL